MKQGACAYVNELAERDAVVLVVRVHVGEEVVHGLLVALGKVAAKRS
jgi:hypothetical protein